MSKELITEIGLKIANNKNIIQIMTREGNDKEVTKAKKHLVKNEKKLAQLTKPYNPKIKTYGGVNFGRTICIYEFMSVIGKLLEEDFDEFEDFDVSNVDARHDFFQPDNNDCLGLIEATSKKKYPYQYVREMYTTYNERNDMYHQIWERKSDGVLFRYSIYDMRYNEAEELIECVEVEKVQFDFE